MKQFEVQGLLADALAWADKIGRLAGIRLIVDSGTLLGLIRNNNLLSWDMDLDFSVVDKQGNNKLLSIFESKKVHVWRYDGKIYKIDIDQANDGPPLSADIKFFERKGDKWSCPAIRSAGMWGRDKGGASFLRRMINPVWRQALYRLDTARFPLRTIVQVDNWEVPCIFFDKLVSINKMSHCLIPTDVEDYLSFRYGDWQIPNKDWIPCRDDGGYRRNE